MSYSRRTISIILIIVLSMIFITGCITINAPPPSTPAKPPVTVEVTEPPVILSFTVEPAEIGIDDIATLKWQATGVQNISIDQGIGAASAVGDHKVEPKTTTTYTLTAANSIGTVSKSVTVSVVGNVNAQKIALTRDDVRLYGYAFASSGSIKAEDTVSAYSVKFVKGNETLTNTVYVYSPTGGGSERKYYEIEGQDARNSHSLYSIGDVLEYYIISRATNEDDVDRFAIRFVKNNVWVHLGFVPEFQMLQTLAKMLVARVYD